MGRQPCWVGCDALWWWWWGGMGLSLPVEVVVVGGASHAWVVGHASNLPPRIPSTTTPERHGRCTTAWESASYSHYVVLVYLLLLLLEDNVVGTSVPTTTQKRRSAAMEVVLQASWNWKTTPCHPKKEHQSDWTLLIVHQRRLVLLCQCYCHARVHLASCWWWSSSSMSKTVVGVVGSRTVNKVIGEKRCPFPSPGTTRTMPMEELVSTLLATAALHFLWLHNGSPWGEVVEGIPLAHSYFHLLDLDRHHVFHRHARLAAWATMALSETERNARRTWVAVAGGVRTARGVGEKGTPTRGTATSACGIAQDFHGRVEDL